MKKSVGEKHRRQISADVVCYLHLTVQSSYDKYHKEDITGKPVISEKHSFLSAKILNFRIKVRLHFSSKISMILIRKAALVHPSKRAMLVMIRSIE
ncbi:MAG: hypothetical protein EHM64_05010 [Ignavibacteriae bacterium]|nr:MAG: hypothetical protein EHM64_05010 [Ignavibacteriota bacterium]